MRALLDLADDGPWLTVAILYRPRGDRLYGVDPLLPEGFLPETVAAQAIEVDEGAFIVELGGRAVGTEEFRIRRSGFGDNARTIAQGTLEITQGGATQVIQSALGTLGVGMSLDAYQVGVSAPTELSIRLERRGARMVSATTSNIFSWAGVVGPMR